jgi:hypothetical protein
MGLEFVNRHVAKIVLAMEEGDSINRIATKADTSYSYDWITRLEDIGVVERADGVRVADDGFVEAFEAVARTVMRRDLALDDAYLVPNFAGLPYRFSKTDAVYVWTKGGYQIGRNRNDYPIFIDVREDDVEAWQRFLGDFGIETTVGERTPADGIHFVVNPMAAPLACERVDSACVLPLDQTVAWAEEYRANFEPALELLDELYDLDLGVTYRERNDLAP